MFGKWVLPLLPLMRVVLFGRAKITTILSKHYWMRLKVGSKGGLIKIGKPELAFR